MEAYSYTQHATARAPLLAVQFSSETALSDPQNYERTPTRLHSGTAQQTKVLSPQQYFYAFQRQTNAQPRRRNDKGKEIAHDDRGGQKSTERDVEHVKAGNVISSGASSSVAPAGLRQLRKSLSGCLSTQGKAGYSDRYQPLPSQDVTGAPNHAQQREMVAERIAWMEMQARREVSFRANLTLKEEQQLREKANRQGMLVKSLEAKERMRANQDSKLILQQMEEQARQACKQQFAGSSHSWGSYLWAWLSRSARRGYMQQGPERLDIEHVYLTIPEKAYGV